MTLTARDLYRLIGDVRSDTEVRIGDVAEGDELHCSVGRVMRQTNEAYALADDMMVWKMAKHERR